MQLNTDELGQVVHIFKGSYFTWRMLASEPKLYLLQVACPREDVAVKFVGQKLILRSFSKVTTLPFNQDFFDQKKIIYLSFNADSRTIHSSFRIILFLG